MNWPISHQGDPSTCSYCNLRESPYEIYTLSSVRRLCLSRNNFGSLPDNIRYLYNLKWLDLKYCEQLVSLPVLPPNLHWLDAHGCISLENIGSQLALILAETEHPHSTFTFTNCTKLDQVAKNGIVSYVRRKIQSMSDAIAHQEKGSKLDVLIGVCYPSWQLPVWFNHRTVGSKLKQNLPRHWNEDGLTGISLCAVVSFKDYQATNNRILVRCTTEFKEKDEPFIQFSCILGGWTEHGSDRPREIIESSGHVFIGYTSLLHIKKWDIEELFAATVASFEFEVTDGTNQITNCEVVKCGFTLIYAPTKPIHPFCTEKSSDRGETMCGSTTESRVNINNEESHFQILSGEASSSSVMVSEITEKIQPFKATRNVKDIKYRDKTVAASSKGDSGIPLEVSFDVTTTNNNGGFMSPMSSGGGEVIDEESPKIDETNPGVETRSCESPEDTEKSGNEQNTRNGANNLCERMEKPIRLICLVVTICAVSAFLLGKDNKKR
ncbi:LRR-like disease resistance protein [Raphanus sativus]|nr:LRR-like disease resistance protein [Raphanus sativus]